MIGRTISHYKVLEKIGTGGMGVVYKAEDTRLKRFVALKFLPPDLTEDNTAKARFLHEARAASALQHHNICTIHEVEEAEPGRLFICMDHYEGATLKEKLTRGALRVDEAIGLTIQVAQGLEEAHRRGILHRDIKPANVMITNHGLAKILDFGLARMEGQTQVTKTGTTVGTAAYMSPEQVRGEALDSRTDIFSLGVMFYELLTGVTPFAADHESAVIYKILHVAPPSLRAFGVQRAAQLDPVIGKMLAKETADRYKNTREIIEDLTRISRGVEAAPPRRKRWRIAFAVLAPAVAALAVVLIARGPHQTRVVSEGTSFRPARVTTVMSREDIGDAAISPDGRHIAYVAGPPGEETLTIRQLATETDVQILGPLAESPGFLRFSPDGDYIFFVAFDPDKAPYRALYQVPSLGGTPRKRASDVDSRVSFAPDGRHVCFYRASDAGDSLIVLDLDSGRDRVLATSKPPELFMFPSWSPDGGRIVVPVQRQQGARLVAFRLDDGAQETIAPQIWNGVWSADWLPDGEGVLLTAAGGHPTADHPQIWLFSTRSGGSRRITHDVYDYRALSVSADATSLAAVRFSRVINLWSMDTAFRRSRQLTFASTPENGVLSYDVAHDGSIAFLTPDRASFKKIEPAESGVKTLFAGAPAYGSIWSWLPDGRIVFSRFDEDTVGRIHVANADGRNARRLLATPEGAWLVDVSRDGRNVLYRLRDRPEELWMVDVTGRDPVRVASSTFPYAPATFFSPSGRLIISPRVDKSERGFRLLWMVLPSSRGEVVAEMELPQRVGRLKWGPDDTSLTFLDPGDGGRNLYRVRPGDAGIEPVTRFTEGAIIDHAWSPDGTRILLIRRVGRDNLWVTSADGSRSEQLTDFETGTMFEAKWAPDGSGIVFTHGQEGRDLVLIRDWRKSGEPANK